MKMVIFGASGGLGSQVAHKFSSEYEVISLSSKDVDIRDFKSVHRFFESNPSEIVVNLSGYNFDTFVHKISDTTLDEVHRLLDVNINGNINLLASCLPKMRERGYGRVILVSSVLSTRTIPGTALYSASKSFIDSLVRVTSAENVSKNITCNSIRLGYFDGGMCHRLPEKTAEMVKNNIGLKRWGSIDELYTTIKFLIDNAYYTGQNIEVSGGLL